MQEIRNISKVRALCGKYWDYLGLTSIFSVKKTVFSGFYRNSESQLWRAFSLEPLLAIAWWRTCRSLEQVVSSRFWSLQNVVSIKHVVQIYSVFRFAGHVATAAWAFVYTLSNANITTSDECSSAPRTCTQHLSHLWFRFLDNARYAFVTCVL